MIAVRLLDGFSMRGEVARSIPRHRASAAALDETRRIGCIAAMRRFARLAVSVSLLAAGDAVAQGDDGFRFAPDLGWRHGDHHADLRLIHRTRGEYWDAFRSGDGTTFGGSKSRLRLRYGWSDQILAVVEGQHVALYGMDEDASGLEATYRNANSQRSHASQLQLRQAWLGWTPIPELDLRLGRQDVKLGAEIDYEEPDWKYLKTARLGERLLGTVGFSHVERASDAFLGAVKLDEHRVDAWAARPTTGVFAVDDGMRPLHDVVHGGVAWTVKRGTWLADTELSLFALGYADDRAPKDGGLADGSTIYTTGASLLGVYDLGPGRFDVTLWAAGQWGTYDGDDHRAAAGVAEVGYQLPAVLAAPWLRVGLNTASGDSDPGDGTHRTFANLLPTNHLYYGFADQLAFQNLVNPFVQLKLTPHPKVVLNFFVHGFWLMTRDDARYSGTGAFDRQSFGYNAQASGGQSDVGVEYDAVATVQVHRTTSLELGFSYLDGGDVFASQPSRDVTFAYASLEFRY
jgi:hypothetical protein